MKKSISRAAVLAVAATLALSACTGEEKATFDQASGTPSAAPSGETPATGAEATTAPGDGTSAESAAAAGVNLAELGKPIASATMPANVIGDPDATMEVALYSLKREGKTVTGIYSFRVTSDTEGTDIASKGTGAGDARRLWDYLGGDWDPYLVDTVNLARHGVLKGEGSEAKTEPLRTTFRPGQTFYAFAIFAAPPADVTTMTVQLVDGAPAVTDVPVR